MRALLVLLGVLVLGFTAYVLQVNESQMPEELGDVAWLRDFDAAAAQAKAKGLPMFVQFQEVPG